MTFLRAVAVMTAKDLRLELRSKETLATMMLVAVLVLLVFVFALDPDSPSGRPADVGVLWAALVFGAAIGLGRSFSRERHEGRLLAMLLAPVDRSAIFMAKWAGFTALLLAMAVVVVPAYAAFFYVTLTGGLWRWAALVIVVAAGLAGVGVLLAAVTAMTRAPDLLLPVLLLPLVVPLLLGAVSVSQELLSTGQWAHTSGWLRLMIAYDLLFIAAPALLFEYVAEV